MTSSPGHRLLAAALLQGLVDWDTLASLVKHSPEGDVPTAEAIVASLKAKGLLSDLHEMGLDETVAAPSPAHTGAPTHGATSPAAEPPAASQFLTALSIPVWRQYRNLRFVGEGGMGRIFKAFDASLRRPVALKFLRRNEPELIARFLLEAQHQALVEHPNVCRVYEVGEEHGISFIAMQFIKGESLDAGGQALTLEQKVQVMEEVAEAVHAAHRQGLIHRDLKPANIMLEPHERGCPRPWVLDFGLARGIEQTGLTVEGRLVGTYHFMAPEQARGHVQSLTRRTDIYSLGATYYALLTGRPPFWESEGLECVTRTLNEDPTPLRRLLPDLPEDLETIVHKCLEKEASQRYDSARDLAEDLRRFRDNEPIRARRPTLAYRARKIMVRHRLLVRVAAATLAVVLGLGIFSGYTWFTARRRAAYAQLYGQEAAHLEALARYIHLMPQHDIRAHRKALVDRIGALERQIAREGWLARGPGAYALGRGHWALGDIDTALRHFQRALATGYDDPVLRQALGRVQLAHYQRALQEAQSLGDPDARALAIRQAERTWRDPARANLGPEGGEPLDGARIAFAEGRLEAALHLARQAALREPWHYEALALQAALMQAGDRSRERPEDSVARLCQAAACLQEAQRIAPSDPDLRLAEARAWVDMLGFGTLLAQMPEGAQQGAEKAIAALDQVEPSRPEALRLRARLQMAWVVLKMRRGEDTYSSLSDVLVLADRALSAAGDRRDLRREARTTLIDVLYRRAHVRNSSPESEADVGRAMALVQEGLKEEPNDFLLRRLGAALDTLAFMRNVQMGRNPWAAFEGALGHLRAVLALAPERPPLLRSLANLWMERAEAERKFGQDPSPSLRHALEALAVIQRIQPGYPRLDSMLAQIYLVWGDWKADQCQDPMAEYGQARLAVQRELDRVSDDYNDLYTLACARLGEAEWQRSSGLDAAKSLSEARRIIALSGSGGRKEWLILKARLLLLQGGRNELAQVMTCLRASAFGGLTEVQMLDAEAALYLREVHRYDALATSLQGLPSTPRVQKLRGKLTSQ